ncbi:Cell wall synthesis protein kre9 precursor [Saxophila tyrrhenica]|uniref:Cell wall synthesis protein kre9 n=1 Tax=Saxophila tyrrhenica TaxID=1690608 RepID=A0AAV9P4G7_9PEZI|nr:Cell wall synthesis protein kre9 precursor [Saxophila tyrrhenica]
MRLHLLPLTLLAALTPSILAAPKITSPAPGASISAGSITVEWTDDGDDPSLSQFQSYTLTLWVGGNSPSNSAGLVAIGPQGNKLPSSGQVTGTIDPTITASLANGFYIQMIATAKTGTVTANSGRFSLTGMTGSPQSAAIRKAVSALGSSNASPPDVNGVAGAAPVASVPAAVPAPADGAFDVAYTMQTGLTRYAPMQGVPPTKITVKDFKPLFPTSAYTVATTWLARPTIVTTVTESQTFTRKQSVNQAKAQEQPTPNNDMQKFLKRWKD